MLPSLNKMISAIHQNRLVLIAGLFLICLSLLRTAIHVDEARYLTVAWEMFANKDYIVPHLNGEPYAHKPPLLFWLTNAIWSITGVHLWSARLIPILFILLTALVLAPLYETLFSKEKSPLLTFISHGFFLSSFLIIGISQLFMFDVMMMFWVTLGWLIILRKEQNPALLGLIMGLAILTKGPVIFIYLIPVLIIQGILDPTKRTKRTIGYNLIAIAIGCAIGLSWALLAAYQGGEDYAQALLWKQSANRLVSSPYHARPWWFYLVFLPAFLIPGWFMIPWKSIATKTFWQESSVKMIGLWLVSIFFLFTLVSCKQLQYLVPLVPLISLLMTHAYQQGRKAQDRPIKVLLGCSFILFAIIIFPLNQQLEKRLPLQGISQTLLPFTNAPLAFLHTKYHGELGFPTKRLKVDHFEEVRDLRSWFTKNPGGIAILFDSPTFFPGYYHFDWFQPIPHGWDYLAELARFYENYIVIARFPGKNADKIVVRQGGWEPQKVIFNNLTYLSQINIINLENYLVL